MDSKRGQDDVVNVASTMARSRLKSPISIGVIMILSSSVKLFVSQLRLVRRTGR